MMDINRSDELTNPSSHSLIVRSGLCRPVDESEGGYQFLCVFVRVWSLGLN
jgi:hypothetical protein